MAQNIRSHKKPSERVNKNAYHEYSSFYKHTTRQTFDGRNCNMAQNITITQKWRVNKNACNKKSRY